MDFIDHIWSLSLLILNEKHSLPREWYNTGPFPGSSEKVCELELEGGFGITQVTGPFPGSSDK